MPPIGLVESCLGVKRCACRWVSTGVPKKNRENTRFLRDSLIAAGKRTRPALPITRAGVCVLVP